MDIPLRTVSNMNWNKRKRILEMGDATQTRENARQMWAAIPRLKVDDANVTLTFSRPFEMDRNTFSNNASAPTTSYTTAHLWQAYFHRLGPSDILLQLLTCGDGCPTDSPTRQYLTRDNAHSFKRVQHHPKMVVKIRDRGPITNPQIVLL